MYVCLPAIETAGLTKPFQNEKTGTDHCWSVVRPWSGRGTAELWRGKGILCRGTAKLCRGPRYPQNRPK